MAGLAALLVLQVLTGAGDAAWVAGMVINAFLCGLTAWALWSSRRHSRHTAASDGPAPVARNHLLFQVSHEIRTPMNAVLGMTQLALQTSLTPEQRQLLTQADASARALLALVDDALDVARIEAGQARLEPHPFRLEDVVAQALDQVRPLHAKPGVALICDWADGSLLAGRGQLVGDAPRLLQLLATLLAQALRCTASGQVLLRLAADPTDAQERVPLRITVQDTGPGLSTRQLQRLREGDTRTMPAPDLGEAGIGLTLARQLTGLLGGRLDAQSQPGQGSSFEAHVTLAIQPTGVPPPPSAAQRLLLAQQPGPAREATLATLRHLGQGDGLVACVQAHDVLDAVADAQRQAQPFDWLLLDWRLPGPGPTGADLLALLRRDHPALRIAVLSSPGAEGDPGDARAFGARAVLSQPVTPGELRRLLDAVSGETAFARAAGGDAASLTGLRVLLVEDHPMNQEIAVRMLSGRGAVVDVASNGQAGLDRLQARGPGAYDLVLMDLEMPVLDGLSATRQLRSMPGFADLPVLAMTAHVLPEEKAQCLAAGMQGHIAKPLNVRRLVHELQHYRPAPAAVDEGPVLEVERGLRQFDGQVALYRRTLQGFADQYAPGTGHWADWLAGHDWAALRRAAHTLQGLAATIGARPLHAAALALEQATAVADLPHATSLLARTQAALDLLLAEVQAVLSRDLPAPAATVVTAGDLAELRDLLAQSDSRALDWWQAHGAGSGLAQEVQHRVSAALEALDFDAATAALGPERQPEP